MQKNIILQCFTFDYKEGFQINVLLPIHQYLQFGYNKPIFIYGWLSRLLWNYFIYTWCNVDNLVWWHILIISGFMSICQLYYLWTERAIIWHKFADVFLFSLSCIMHLMWSNNTCFFSFVTMLISFAGNALNYEFVINMTE